jgi:hypothetical protein
VGGGWAITGGFEIEHKDVRLGAGGTVGLRGASLFSLQGALVLPLLSSSLTLALSPLKIGHWCHFSALYDINLHLQALHC